MSSFKDQLDELEEIFSQQKDLLSEQKSRVRKIAQRFLFDARQLAATHGREKNFVLKQSDQRKATIGLKRLSKLGSKLLVEIDKLKVETELALGVSAVDALRESLTDVIKNVPDATRALADISHPIASRPNQDESYERKLTVLARETYKTLTGLNRGRSIADGKPAGRLADFVTQVYKVLGVEANVGHQIRAIKKM